MTLLLHYKNRMKDRSFLPNLVIMIKERRREEYFFSRGHFPPIRSLVVLSSKILHSPYQLQPDLCFEASQSSANKQTPITSPKNPFLTESPLLDTKCLTGGNSSDAVLTCEELLVLHRFRGRQGLLVRMKAHILLVLVVSFAFIASFMSEVYFTNTDMFTETDCTIVHFITLHDPDQICYRSFCTLQKDVKFSTGDPPSVVGRCYRDLKIQERVNYP